MNLGQSKGFYLLVGLGFDICEKWEALILLFLTCLSYPSLDLLCELMIMGTGKVRETHFGARKQELRLGEYISAMFNWSDLDWIASISNGWQRYFFFLTFIQSPSFVIHLWEFPQ